MSLKQSNFRICVSLCAVLCAVSGPVAAQQAGETRASGSSTAQSKKEREENAKTLATKAAEALKVKPRADGLIPANAKQTVLIDRARKRVLLKTCLLYTSPSPRDQRGSRMPSSA